MTIRNINNRDEYTFYSVKVDENNEVLDFKKEKALRKLVVASRSLSVYPASKEVFSL